MSELQAQHTSHRAVLGAPWPLAPAIALALLIGFDAAFRMLWHPHPSRLPEQFTAAYLETYIDAARATSPLLVLGDSALWGYHLDAGASVVARIAEQRESRPILNLAYEGGSVVNSYWALRLALARGVRPAVVLVNLNSKEFNAADSAYRRLYPALERAVGTSLAPRDRALLALAPPPALADQLDDTVSSVWAFYRHRVDVRVALFGVDDAAGWLTDRLHAVTGESKRFADAHRVTAEAFAATYDLEIPAPDNVELIYLRALRDLLVQQHVRALLFLTPTNHRLLPALDDPAYADTLQALSAAARGPGLRVVDLDRLDVGGHFIDNDHLDAQGSRILATRLAHELDRIAP